MSCGCTTEFGAFLAASKTLEWNPIPGQVLLPPTHGLPSPTASGTATLRAVTSTNIQGASGRLGFVSAAVVNSVAGVRSATNQFRNAVATLGQGRYKGAGWRALFQWSLSDAIINPEATMFVGMSASTAVPTNVNPTTLVNAIGFGVNAGEATLRVYATDAVGNFQTVDLGVNFPANIISVDCFWRATIFCAPGQVAPMRYEWRVERLQTGQVAAGTFIGLLGVPDDTVAMSPRMWRATGPVSALAVGIDLGLVRVTPEL